LIDPEGDITESKKRGRVLSSHSPDEHFESIGGLLNMGDKGPQQREWSSKKESNEDARAKH